MGWRFKLVERSSDVVKVRLKAWSWKAREWKKEETKRSRRFTEGRFTDKRRVRRKAASDKWAHDLVPRTSLSLSLSLSLLGHPWATYSNDSLWYRDPGTINTLFSFCVHPSLLQQRSALLSHAQVFVLRYTRWPVNAIPFWKNVVLKISSLFFCYNFNLNENIAKWTTVCISNSVLVFYLFLTFWKSLFTKNVIEDSICINTHTNIIYKTNTIQQSIK